MIKALFKEMVEANPGDSLLPDSERLKIMNETFVRSRQFITLCMVLEMARLIYLNTKQYKPYQVIIWVLELVIIFAMMLLIFKSQK